MHIHLGSPSAPQLRRSHRLPRWERRRHPGWTIGRSTPDRERNRVRRRRRGRKTLDLFYRVIGIFATATTVIALGLGLAYLALESLERWGR